LQDHGRAAYRRRRVTVPGPRFLGDREHRLTHREVDNGRSGYPTSTRSATHTPIASAMPKSIVAGRVRGAPPVVQLVDIENRVPAAIVERIERRF
jgi:hypothetical protein